MAGYDAQAAVQAGVDDLIVVCQLAGFQHDLQGLEAAAVGQGDEAILMILPWLSSYFQFAVFCAKITSQEKR